MKLFAQDLVAHFERCLDAMDGEAIMACTSRRICMELYRKIVALRPNWHHDDDDKGEIKVVMTGSASDPLDWQPHIRKRHGKRSSRCTSTTRTIGLSGKMMALAISGFEIQMMVARAGGIKASLTRRTDRAAQDVLSDR